MGRHLVVLLDVGIVVGSGQSLLCLEAGMSRFVSCYLESEQAACDYALVGFCWLEHSRAPQFRPSE